MRIKRRSVEFVLSSRQQGDRKGRPYKKREGGQHDRVLVDPCGRPGSQRLISHPYMNRSLSFTLRKAQL